MDPLRGVIHLGLKLTETTLDRALDVVRLADTLIVASAVPPVREPTADEPTWPEEEQADLDALSATLRARQESGSTPARRTTKAATSGSARKTSTATKAPAKKTTATRTPAKKTTATKAPAKKTTATKTSAKKATPKKTTPKKATSKKTSPRKAPAKKATSVTAAETPTLDVLPDE